MLRDQSEWAFFPDVMSNNRQLISLKKHHAKTKQWNKGNASRSTETFDWGFCYLLVGKVWGTKTEMEVRQF